MLTCKGLELILLTLRYYLLRVIREFLGVILLNFLLSLSFLMFISYLVDSFINLHVRVGSFYLLALSKALGALIRGLVCSQRQIIVVS